MKIKKEENSSYPIYDMISLSKIVGKTQPLSWKISWIWTCCQIFGKFGHWENLLLFWMVLKKASAHL